MAGKKREICKEMNAGEQNNVAVGGMAAVFAAMRASRDGHACTHRKRGAWSAVWASLPWPRCVAAFRITVGYLLLKVPQNKGNILECPLCAFVFEQEMR